MVWSAEGMPTDVTEQVFVEVDHCDPICIILRARGTYPCLLINLPRAEEDGSCEEASLSKQHLLPFSEEENCGNPGMTR